VAGCPASLDTAHRAARVVSTSTATGSLIGWVAFRTHPKILFAPTFGHLVGRGVARMPLSRQAGVILYGPARTETTTSAGAVGADYVASNLCQVVNSGLPLMDPAAFMDAARAAQPDPLMALVGEIGRQLAQVLGWVPHALNQLVVWVR